MRGELQRHLIKTNVDIRMVIAFLSFPGDLVDEIHAFQESLKLFARISTNPERLLSEA